MPRPLVIKEEDYFTPIEEKEGGWNASQGEKNY